MAKKKEETPAEKKAKAPVEKKAAPSEKKAKASVEKKTETVAEKKAVKDVHDVSFVAGKGWAVKRQNSDKVIKYFKTKLEAVEYVIKVSGNQKTSVVIHLKNGKFQKFDSAVRALAYAKEKAEE